MFQLLSRKNKKGAAFFVRQRLFAFLFRQEKRGYAFLNKEEHSLISLPDGGLIKLLL
jgi:hypothetical protein